MNQDKYEKFKAIGEQKLAQANATDDVQGRLVHRGYLRAVEEIRQDTIADELATPPVLEIPVADEPVAEPPAKPAKRTRKKS